MALIVADRVVESSTTTGTGAFTLAAAYTGYRRFSAVCSTNDTVYYTIEAVDGNGNPSGDWETGLGTYSSANTLTRTSVSASSNANAAVNFAAGTKRVSLNVTAAHLATYQPLDSDLTALANAAWAQGDIPYRDGSGLTRLPAGTAGQVLVTAGSGANPSWAWRPRMLYSTGVSTDSTATTSELVLLPSAAAYTLPANTMANAGDMLRVKASGKLAGNTRARTIKLYMGSSYTVSFTTSNASNTAWEIELEHVRTASGTKMSRYKFRTGPNGGAGDINFQSGTVNDSLDWTVNQDIKVTGQTAGAAAAADTNCNSLTVEYIPAP